MSLKRSVAVVAFVCCGLVLFISLLGGAGYLLYSSFVTLQKEWKQHKQELSKRYAHSKAPSSSVAEARRQAAGVVQRRKNALSRTRQKSVSTSSSRQSKPSYGELLARELERQIAATPNLFSQGDYSRAYEDYKLLVLKISPWREQTFHDTTFQKWLDSRKQEFESLISREATRLLNQLQKNEADPVQLSFFLQAFYLPYRQKEFMKSLVSQVTPYLSEKLENHIVISLKLPSMKYYRPLANAIQSKYVPIHGHALIILSDIPSVIRIKPLLQFRFTIWEKRYPISDPNRIDWQVPIELTIRGYAYRSSFPIPSTWKQLSFSGISLSPPARSSTSPRKVATQYRDRLAGLLESSLKERLPKLELFPEVNPETASLLNSRRQIDGKVVMALALKNPPMLLKKAQEILKDPPSQSIRAILLGKLMELDIREAAPLILEHVPRFDQRMMNYFIRYARRNPAFADYQVAFKVLTIPGGEKILYMMKEDLKKEAILTKVEQLCLSSETPNRSKLIYPFFYALSPQQKEKYWPLIEDKDASVANAVLANLRGSDQFCQQFFSRYPKLQTAVQQYGWRLLSQRNTFSENEIKLIISKLKPILANRKDPCFSSVQSALGKLTQKPEIWQQCLPLVREISN
ncbi:MAG: hypothetical protein D6820_01005, partial [Lentisphaerae bacterium]